MLTVAQVAQAAEVPERTVRDHLASGRLVGTKLGRDWLIDERAARAWIAAYTPYDTLRRRQRPACPMHDADQICPECAG
jgi:excisionase family DNA binding protein